MHHDQSQGRDNMKKYAEAFYKGRKWKKVSGLYMTQQHYVCERCGGVGCICHHKKYITPWNINNPDITLNTDNLECLCQECHNQEHMAKVSRAIFDGDGNMTGVQESAEIREYRKALEALEGLTGKKVSG